MRHRKMTRGCVALALVLSAGWSAAQPAHAQAGRKSAGDDKAVRAVDEAFVAAYNKADVDALAAMFTDDAEVIEADGARYQGRQFVARSFADTFAVSKGAKIALEVASIRFLTPDVAHEEGRSVVTPASGTPVARYYTVLYVKRGDRWLMANVREEPDPVVRPHERLKELEWMVGDWLDEGSDHTVKASCRWSSDGNFLLRDFQVVRDGKIAMSVTQRVGWDPAANEFRSWQFDTEGGFGEGRWARDGNRWIVKESGVRPDGTTATSTRITVKLRPDLVRWTLVDRVIGGEAIPGKESSVLTRVPPSPRLDLAGGAAPAKPADADVAPNSNTERSPR